MTTAEQLRALVDAEMERRRTRYANHYGGPVPEGDDDRLAAEVAVALALLEERDAALAQAEELTRALRATQAELATLRAAVRECAEATDAAAALYVAGRLGKPGTPEEVARAIARHDAAGEALRKLAPRTEAPRG